MLKRFSCFILIFAAVGTSNANELYFGAKYMMLAVDLNYFDSKFGDTTSEAYALFAGNKLSDRLSVEGSLVVSSKDTDIYIPSHLDPAEDISIPVSLNHFINVSAIAKQPLFGGLALSARAGVASLKWDSSGEANAKTIGFTYGGTLAYEYSNNARMFLGYQKFPDAKSSVDSNFVVTSRTISLGASFQF